MANPLQLPRARAGISVVEVIVALMLITIGLLAVAGSSALALRTSLEATRRREAAHRVASRYARLEAAGCSHAAAGSDSDVGRMIQERWVVVSRTAAFVIVADSITWTGPRGRVTRSLTGAIPC
jgi:Tfp pilus assembly protein PilV